MQLFTHLLSSYLQGMGDFFSALPRGESLYLLCLRAFEWRSFPLGKAGMGLLCWLVRTPGNSDGVAAADGWPLPGPPQGAGVPTCCV